ncbi:MAG: thioesterase family protein [Bacteroidota bacterium]|nr:thioesterase family protein [Bacteroidota bacterium]
MARVKLHFPEKYFDIPIKIPVRITDINYGDHVGNDALVAIIHEARVQFFQHYGYTELNIEGIGLLMSELIVEFKNESFYKDIIEVKISIGEVSKVSFELFYKLITERNIKSILIANAKTTMVCYNYEQKKVVVIPQQLRDIF